MREAGEAIETLLAADQKQEARKCITSWYRQASGGRPPQSREHLDLTATERAELCRCRPPEGLRVPILVTPVKVEYGVTEEEDIVQAAKDLKGGRAGGLLGMRAEELKVHLQEALRENNPVRRRWRLLVRLIQKTF